MDKINLEYKNNLVLTGLGGVSNNLIYEVKDILEKDFKFKGISIVINEDISNIKPFLDGEPRFKQKRAELEEAYKGKHVFIVQHLKIFDNRLRNLLNSINSFNVEDTELKEKIKKFSYFIYSDIDNKVSARFRSTRFNPSAIEKQLVGQIYAAKMCQARHISVVIPKTIFEWSHHFTKRWKEDQVYEMPSFLDFLERISNKGAQSVIILHPHAPKEGLEISKMQNLNYVIIFPQTFTLSSNRWRYSVNKIFKNYKIFNENFDPIKDKIEKDKDKLGDLKKISHLLMFSSSVDEGSRNNSEAAAERFNFKYIKSAKYREDEGNSKIIDSDNIGDHLTELMKHTRDATIRIYMFDDMINSGKTVNNEAKLRKDQIQEFNKKNNTNYKIFIEVIATHLRLIELKYLHHNFVDKITVFDTVPYLPSLEEQLEKLGILSKFNIIKKTAYQLALGIALDYFAQNIHHFQLERDIEIGSYRESTDRELVKEHFGEEKNQIIKFD